MKKRLGLRAGFTLVELIVVVAVLALLAALILPRFDSLVHNAGHVAGASSMADAGQMIEAWYTANRTYPDGWDTRLQGNSLLSASTGAAPASGSTTVLPTELVGTTGRLTTTTLSAGDVQGFLNVGIQTLYSMDTAPLSELSRPDDWFNTATQLTAGSTPTVAIINQPNATKIIDHIYPNNLVVSTGVSGTIPSNSAGTYKLVAFGLGRQNSLITGVSPSNGTLPANLSNALMREAPVDGSFNPALMYNRLLVVFQVVPSTSGGASSVTFAGVFGADGDLITDDAAAINSAVQ